MARNRVAIAYDCLFPLTTGGGERLYHAYAERMARRGIDVDYLTATQWTDDAAPSEPSFRVVAISPRLRLYDAHGVRRTASALRFAWGVFRSLAKRRNDYDAVIVSGLPLLNVFAARLALVGSSTRLVVDYLEVWGRRQWAEYAGVLTGNIAWILQRAAIAVTPIATCHSQLTATQLNRQGFRGRLLRSPGLIDGASSHVLVDVPATPPYVLYAGRHIPDKRVETLPAAVAVARERVAELRLIILGSGPSTADIDRAVGASGASEWTDRPGFVSQDSLDELMRGAAVLVNPSRREGYGLVVVEASAHGTPVVLVDDPGNAATELIEPDVNGFISESCAPNDLGTAIADAIAGGSALRRRARSWYESAIRTRTVDRTVDGILAELGLAESVPIAPEDPTRGRT